MWMSTAPAKHTLFIANDNDYPSVVGGKSNPNQFCVIALDDGHWPRDQQDSSRRISVIASATMTLGRRSTAMRATTTVTDAVAAPRGSECG